MMRFLSILLPALLFIACFTSTFGKETATEIVAARELIRGRLDSDNNELADALRSAIWSLGRSHLDSDKELLAKCLRFKKEPTGGFSSEEAGLYFPVRGFCLSTTHALAFIDEFRTTESLSYKLLIASEVIKATGQNVELRAAYDLIRADSEAGDFGSGEAVDEVIYVAEGLFKNQDLNRRLNWDAIESTGAYPLDPNSRNVLHECFPDWKWLKANVPKPSEDEVLNYVKATDSDASARMVVLPSVTPKPVLAETVVTEHSFWQTGSLWLAFGVALLVGLGAWFWRGRRA